MPFPEYRAVKCKTCHRHLATGGQFLASSTDPDGELMVAAMFEDISEASRAAIAAGWYVDARTEQCPRCWSATIQFLEEVRGEG